MSNKKNFEPPKGTRDFLPGQMIIRDQIIRRIIETFENFGYQHWDGPAFESLSLLKRKGEDAIEKEIYAFKDKGDRELGLRFELTTTLARIIASSPKERKPIRAYNFGKVWRYERPQKGRYREFLQMDADIFGADNPGAEIELLSIAVEILKKLHFKNYKILINHREFLNALSTRTRTKDKQEMLRIFDKLEKIGWDGIKEEFKNKNLSESSFNILYNTTTSYIPDETSSTAGNIRAYQAILEEPINEFDGIIEHTQNKQPNYSSPPDIDNPNNKVFTPKYPESFYQALNDLQTIAKHFDDTNPGILKFSHSLVRGFGYYTGPIFEIQILDGNMGSVSGGGRYDKLIESFGGEPTSAAGISFGIERLIDIINSQDDMKSKFQKPSVLVQILYETPELLSKALAITNQIRTGSIPADIDLTGRSYNKQFKIAQSRNIPYVLLITSSDDQNEYELKDLSTRGTEKLAVPDVIEKLKRSE